MSGLHRHDRHEGTGRAVRTTLIANVIVLIAKWSAFALTGSASLFGEAAHSSADTMNPLVLWFGHRRSERPSDSRHPHGHGREAFFWSLMAAIMMLLIGSALTAWHGVERLMSGESPDRSYVALMVMGLAFAAESWSLAVVVRRMRVERRESGGSKNPILLALLVENGADVLGVTLAFAGYGLYALTGDPRWDGTFSLAIAALLAVSSIFLVNRSRSLIIGEAAPADIADRIETAARRRPSIAAIRRLTAVMHSPHDIDCRIVVRWDAAWFDRRAMNGRGAYAAGVLDAVAEESESLRRDLRAAVPDLAEIVIENEK